MASPQTENGHIRIANDLYEHIMSAGFTKRELLIVMAVMRLTYGFSKKKAEISNYSIGNLTNQRRDDIAKSIKLLVDKQVIHVRDLRTSPQGYQIKEVCLNKDYDTWIHVRNLRTAVKHVRTQNTAVPCTQNTAVPCTQNASHITNKQTNRQNSGRPPARPRVDPPDGLFLKAWAEYETHRREIRARKLKPVSVEKLQRWLVEQGDEKTQQAIVDETIRNGWTGLFTLKNGNGNGTHSGNGKTDNRSRAKRVSDKLDEIAIAADAEAVGGGTVQAVSGEVVGKVDLKHRGH